MVIAEALKTIAVLATAALETLILTKVDHLLTVSVVRYSLVTKFVLGRSSGHVAVPAGIVEARKTTVELGIAIVVLATLLNHGISIFLSVPG
jgi:uncharacterized protein related to proFAR isomerase